jgi:heme exporter protein A
MPPRRSSVLEAPAAGAGPETPPDAPSAAVEVEGLERSYGDHLALDGVSFRLEAGQTLAVLGANGAGKSTLLRVLAGLLRPHAGVVSVLGARLPRRAAAVRGRIGYVGHEPLLYRDLTGRENLRFHARLHRRGADRVEGLLEATGMGRRAGQPVGELSKGLRQRLAVARALVADPPLLLLDEPRAHLDPAATELLEPLIGRASGRTRVLVTHDLEGALAESDLALGLRAGRPVALERSPSADPRALRGALFG